MHKGEKLLAVEIHGVVALWHIYILVNSTISIDIEAGVPPFFRATIESHSFVLGQTKEIGHFLDGRISDEKFPNMSVHHL